MNLPLQSTPHSTHSDRFSPAMLFILVALAAALLIACNPFSKGGNGANDNSVNNSNSPTQQLSSGTVNVGLEQSQAQPGQTGNPQSQPTDEPATPTPQPEPTPTPTAAPIVATPPAPGTAEEARNLVWAYLTQCVSLSVNDLEAKQIQGEWFVQAADESPEKYGLWKVDPTTGTIQAHNIRARQWEPLINQNCTPELFNGFFTPTPSPLLNSEVAEASQAVTTLWATLVNCYPNMEADDLEATLNSAKGEWVVTAKPTISANYGVWAVASDGTVSPRNRQAQGVFDQLDNGLC